MVLRALRSIFRPVSRNFLANRTAPLAFNLPTTASPSLTCDRHNSYLFSPPLGNVLRIPASTAFHTLTDTQFPKRRPTDKPRRKRSSIRPRGPYAWVKSQPEEPIVLKQPNQGSVKRRNEKKRIKQHHAFVLAEKKKRKAQLQEANKKKAIKRVERKMAAVARERAWTQRLAELQQLEEEKKRAAAL